MSKYAALSRDQLIVAMERIEALATETADLWAGRVSTHGSDCHLRHAGCLAQAVIDEGESQLMSAAVKNVVRELKAEQASEQ